MKNFFLSSSKKKTWAYKKRDDQHVSFFDFNNQWCFVHRMTNAEWIARCLLFMKPNFFGRIFARSWFLCRITGHFISCYHAIMWWFLLIYTRLGYVVSTWRKKEIVTSTFLSEKKTDVYQGQVFAVNLHRNRLVCFVQSWNRQVLVSWRFVRFYQAFLVNRKHLVLKTKAKNSVYVHREEKTVVIPGVLSSPYALWRVPKE